VEGSIGDEEQVVLFSTASDLRVAYLWAGEG
jgi:hypothetical protein